MKLIVFCLFAFCCYPLASSVTNGFGRSQESRKLEEVLSDLKKFKDSLQNSQQLVYTPQNIEDCCCLSALQCFRDNLPDGAGKKRVKLYRSLKDPLTVKGLNFCDSENAQTTCQACSAHPQQNATVFFNRLETLIKSAIMRLRMN
ncbi:interleukin-21 [Xyrichtys novacula]|uniref:Interleukin-21 n=1 Tax=Xyrichtys novacula TaxID=13765 RepID=A0AAV1FDH3_XYRNO|nr:interleukin-21 [Xyrichtys novacula]